MIGVHPRALLEFDQLSPDLQQTIRRQMAGYADPVAFFVEKLCEGIAHDRRRVRAGAGDRAPVGLQVERVREPDRRPAVRAARREPDARLPRRLALRRCGVPAVLRARVPRAEARARARWGSTNVQVMVPFVRTREGGRRRSRSCSPRTASKRGENGLKVIMMCELPTNALLAERYLEYFDGMSIGSNDMTQLTLGLDRDSAIIAKLFDERDDAVKALLDDGDRGLPQARQVHRHLRPGAVGSPRLRALAASSRASRASR